MDLERRYLPNKDAELRVSRKNGKQTIAGYALKYNTLSEMIFEDGKTFREVIRPGAIEQTLNNGAYIECRYNHELYTIFGNNRSGTLKLKPDDTGLYYECEMPDTQAARDCLAQIDHGNMWGSSFAFWVPPGGDNWRKEGTTQIRELLEVDLDQGDVAPVFHPAYHATDVAIAARSLQKWTQKQQTEQRYQDALKNLENAKRFLQERESKK